MFLSGIQLSFNDGIESPLLGGAIDEELNLIPVDPVQAIRYVSMYMTNGNLYCGLRFLDAQQEYIVNETWLDMVESSYWTPLYEMPEGQQIIGIYANTFNDSDYIAFLSFVLVPMT